jgi:hypothetical protein
MEMFFMFVLTVSCADGFRYIYSYPVMKGHMLIDKILDRHGLFNHSSVPCCLLHISWITTLQMILNIIIHGRDKVVDIVVFRKIWIVSTECSNIIQQKIILLNIILSTTQIIHLEHELTGALQFQNLKITF